MCVSTFPHVLEDVHVTINSYTLSLEWSVYDYGDDNDDDNDDDDADVDDDKNNNKNYGDNYAISHKEDNHNKDIPALDGSDKRTKNHI